jgi:OmpA-OmpF porin, OOP family
MKKLSLSVLALTAAFVATSAAYASNPTPGWYAAAGIGDNFAVNPTIEAGGTKKKASAETNNIDFLGSVGYAFSNGFRLESEYFHGQNNIKSVNSVHGFGHVSNNILFFNALYDLKNSTIFTPYIGAGVGPDFINVENVGTAGALLDGDTVELAYQGIAGASAQLDPNWAITADYRYIASLDPKVGYTGGTKGSIENASHNFILGIRYSFGADESPHAVAVPGVVSRAATVPTATVMPDFMVFFDFDKAVLTPEAKKIITAAAQEFKKGGSAKIVVTGHTDTVGTDAYNMKLSSRRAVAVKAELKRLGVKAANIKETGVGEAGLLVPTTDGVREAQNRRAEIVLEK